MICRLWHSCVGFISAVNPKLRDTSVNAPSLLKVRFHLTGQCSPKPTPTRWWCHISWKRKPCVAKASAGDGEAFWEVGAKIVRVCEHECKIPPLLPSYWWYNSFRLLSWKRKGTGWLDLVGVGGCKMISRGGCLTAFGIRIFECQAPIWIEVHCVCACVCVCVQMLFCCSDDWAYYTVWYRPDRPLEPRLKRGFLCVWKWQTERQQSSTDQRADGQHEQTAGEVICLT